jgi:hypothetical protein
MRIRSAVLATVASVSVHSLVVAQPDCRPYIDNMFAGSLYVSPHGCKGGWDCFHQVIPGPDGTVALHKNANYDFVFKTTDRTTVSSVTNS